MNWNPKNLSRIESRMLNSMENSSTIVDEVLFNFTKTTENNKIIDSIMGMSLYILLMFDWEFYADLLKDQYQKDLMYYNNSTTDATQNQVKFGHDLFCFILRTTRKLGISSSIFHSDNK